MAASSDFTKAYWQISFGLICVLLFSPLMARGAAGGGVLLPPGDDEKELMVDLPPPPPPEFARSFNNVVAVSSSDGRRPWEQHSSSSFRQQEVNVVNVGSEGAGAAALLLTTASAGTTAAAAATVVPVGHDDHHLQAAGCRRPMVEIIALIMDNIDDEDPGNLYGRVEVTDVMGRQSIYFRDDEHWEYMYPDKPASLTGPPRPISAKGAVTVHFNLWDRDFTSANDHILEKTITIWEGGAGDGNDDKLKAENGKRRSVKVFGASGAATLDYMVLCDAVAAKIDATLIKGNDGIEDEVFGQIGARIADTEAETLVFNIARDNYTSLMYNVPIPLSRTLVAVPSSAYLHVAAKLYDADFTAGNDDDEIAAGCAYFPARASGTVAKRISGASDSEIEIKVTWISR